MKTHNIKYALMQVKKATSALFSAFAVRLIFPRGARRAYIALVLLCLLPACDIIEEGKYTDNTTPIVVDSTLPKILLEDFTAHKCVNCPDGAAMYHALQEQYPDKIIVVSIHGGSLAVPDAEYPAEFRTQDGARLISDYKAELEGMPCALVSRRQYSEKMAMGRAMWAGAITEYWQNFATIPLKIGLKAQINQANNNEISVEVGLDYLTPFNNNNLISVWIVEDSIVSPQKSINQPNYIPDYVHNNVLRYSFNGAYGENISTEHSIPAGYE